METVVDKLIDFSVGKDEELRDISALGMLSVMNLTTFCLTHEKLSRQLLLNSRLMAESPSLLVAN